MTLLLPLSLHKIDKINTAVGEGACHPYEFFDWKNPPLLSPLECTTIKGVSTGRAVTCGFRVVVGKCAKITAPVQAKLPSYRLRCAGTAALFHFEKRPFGPQRDG